MAKKKYNLSSNNIETPDEEVVLDRYAIHNLTESLFPAPIFDENGEITHVQIRLQGRGGQKPPVIDSTAITPALRNLEKRRFVKLVKV